MDFLGRLDIATLMVCIALASALFSYAFFRLRGTNRSLRGSGAFALAFLIATIAGILIPFVDPHNALLRFLNAVLSETFALIFYAFLLTGIEQFFGVRRLIRPAWFLAAVALLLNIYFASLHESIRARMVVNTVFAFLFRLTLSIELLRQPRRKHLRTLAATMLCFAAVSVADLWEVANHQSPRSTAEWLHSQGSQSISLFLQFVFILATGQLLFLLLNGELLKQVETEATRDYITGVLNRRAIERTLIAEMGRSIRFDLPLSIGLVDIDGFKQINDALGHSEGDRALLAVSRSIEKSLRAYDTVGRFGGDEFLIILPNSTAPEALKVMERLRTEAPRISTGAVTVSIGVTSMLTNEPHSALLDRADKALYLAKQDGRNCTRVSLPTPSGRVVGATPFDLA